MHVGLVRDVLLSGVTLLKTTVIGIFQPLISPRRAKCARTTSEWCANVCERVLCLLAVMLLHAVRYATLYAALDSTPQFIVQNSSTKSTTRTPRSIITSRRYTSTTTTTQQHTF